MTTYVVLVNFTDQGVRYIRQTTQTWASKLGISIGLWGLMMPFLRQTPPTMKPSLPSQLALVPWEIFVRKR